MLIFAFVEYLFWGRNVEAFWCIKLLGILLGLGLIPAIYYMYTGIFGVKADWFNITIFFLVAGIVYRFETKRFQKGYTCPMAPKAALLLIGLIAAAFAVLTFAPPNIPLFEDPLTGTYGFGR